MKKNLIIGMLIFFVSCTKEKHSIRFANYLSPIMINNVKINAVNNVMVGSVSLGTVEPGQTSDYKSINSGNFTVTGNIAGSGALITSSGSISGKGKHKWTVILSDNGLLSIQEDK